MKQAIVIPTHRSGTRFLTNLLESFKGYARYPIIIVISGYRQEDNKCVLSIKDKFEKLPITIETIDTNSFELGGLYTAYKNTDFDEFFLLPHSCEIVNTEIFDIVFEKYKYRSVALGVQTGNWNCVIDHNGRNERIISRYLDKQSHLKLLELGNIKFWQGHIGKYRRAILDKMNLLEYLPTNILEAITKSELLFTSTYHSLDSSTVVLFPDWKDGDVFETKFGKKRKKIANSYLIKWKTHWNVNMIFNEISISHKVKNVLITSFPRIYERLKRISAHFEHRPPR